MAHHCLDLMATYQAAAVFDELSVRIWCLSKLSQIKMTKVVILLLSSGAAIHIQTYSILSRC